MVVDGQNGVKISISLTEDPVLLSEAEVHQLQADEDSD
jgi:hypothetical protein